jgi:hypothetical protein
MDDKSLGRPRPGDLRKPIIHNVKEQPAAIRYGIARLARQGQPPALASPCGARQVAKSPLRAGEIVTKNQGRSGFARMIFRKRVANQEYQRELLSETHSDPDHPQDIMPTSLVSADNIQLRYKNVFALVP